METSTQPIRVIISDCDFNLAMSIDKLTKKHRKATRMCITPWSCPSTAS